MAFRFTLQALLRLRQGLEHQRELQLQEANFQVALARAEILDLDRWRTELAARNADLMRSGLSAAEIQFSGLCREALLTHRRELEKELALREQVRAERSREYQQARQQREVMDTLRQRQLQLYRLKETRQEQRRLDELFLLRRHASRRRS